MRNFYLTALLWSLCLFSIEAYAAPEGDGDNRRNGDEIDIFAHIDYDELVYVEGGTFMMRAYSALTSETGMEENGPADSIVYEVTLLPYYIGKFEVTQQLWEYVMNYTGSTEDSIKLEPAGPYFGGYKERPTEEYGVGDNCPVYWVSYNNIVNEFLPRLNIITGKYFRLPTEAEWEFAARGGQEDTLKYAGSDVISDVAWYTNNSKRKVHPVGSKMPNALGLYDMSGNVWEWCSDFFYNTYEGEYNYDTNPETGYYRVLRGGSWKSEADYCGVSYRDGRPPRARSALFGFRLVLDIEEEEE